jgi:hypothetical protein
MTRETDFVHAVTPVSEDFLDALQEVSSALSTNTRVVQSSTTQIQIVPGNSDGGTLGVVINGKLRYASGVKTQTISGSAGTYNVWVTADAAGRDFAIAFATTSTPAGITNYRKVASVVWSGTAITSFTSYLGAAPLDAADFTVATVVTPATGDDTKKVPNTEWVNDAVMDAMPVGVVLDYTLPSLPSGGKWEWADGVALTAANTAAAPYRAALLSASSPYGVSGSDPRKPDYRGREGVGRYDMGTGNPGDATRNVGSTLGATGGAINAMIAINELPPHTHSVSTSGSLASGATSGSLSVSGSTTINNAGDPVQYTSKIGGSLSQGPLADVNGSTTANKILPSGNSGLPHSHSVSGTTSGSLTVSGTVAGSGTASTITGHTGQTALSKMGPHILVGKIVKVA